MNTLHLHDWGGLLPKTHNGQESLDHATLATCLLGTIQERPCDLLWGRVSASFQNRSQNSTQVYKYCKQTSNKHQQI